MRNEGLHFDFAQNDKISHYDWNLIYGVLSIRNSILAMGTRSYHVLRVNKSIFAKVSIFSPDHVIAYLGVIWYLELNNEHENSSGLAIDGLHVDRVKSVHIWGFKLS